MLISGNPFFEATKGPDPHDRRLARTEISHKGC